MLLLVSNLVIIGLLLVVIFKLVGSGRGKSGTSAGHAELKDMRREIGAALKDNQDSLNKQLFNMTNWQSESSDRLTKTLEAKIKDLQNDNSRQLDKMRQVVDEKLQATLERRLTSSFKQVSDQLEVVHNSLGEMRELAHDVGDLQKVMSNIKTRGAWGEAQLASLLEEVLSPEQYETEFAVKDGSADRVEFALKIPAEDDRIMYLPIDSKLPLDRYHQLVEAKDSLNKQTIAKARKALISQVKKEAAKISSKYVNPPQTTDFAVLYLPLDGLYVEVVSEPGFVAQLRREHKIAVASPTTILPVLNFVQMGYRFLAIHQRSSEVWHLLNKTQAEFAKFGDLLSKAHQKISQAGTIIESAGAKSRNIESKLRQVDKIDYKPTD